MNRREFFAAVLAVPAAVVAIPAAVVAAKNIYTGPPEAFRVYPGDWKIDVIAYGEPKPIRMRVNNILARA